MATPIERQQAHDSPALFRGRSEVVRALSRMYDRVETKSGSIVFVGRSTKRGGSPPGYGLLNDVEERARLVRGLQVLPERDRLLLFLWYVEEWPVVRIAEYLKLSRVHCYRLRDRALDRLTEGPSGLGTASGDLDAVHTEAGKSPHAPIEEERGAVRTRGDGPE